MTHAIVTADLYDLHHAKLSVCDLQFRSFGKRPSFFGQCVTLKTFEDHVPVREAVNTPGNGRILVVDAGGSLRVGVMGDRLAATAGANNWIGAIIFGAIRDSVGIDALDIGVKALGATARKTGVALGGKRDAPVTFGGAKFETGDWVYVDSDCVLVSKTALDIPREGLPA